MTPMATVSPISDLHTRAGAAVTHYGAPDALGTGVRVVEAIHPVEIEYAALRTRAVLLDRPDRAVVRVSGADTIEFLNRMLTQELAPRQPGGGEGLPLWGSCRSFWLSRKGRIDADLRVSRLGPHDDRKELVGLELDVHAVQRLLQGRGEKGETGLPGYVFAEEIKFADCTQSLHRLSLIGPAAIAILNGLSRPVAGPLLADLAPGRCCEVDVIGIDGAPRRVWVDRTDDAGEIGLEMTVGLADVQAVYEALSSLGPGAGADAGVAASDETRALRAGWHAYNIARIETGTALFNLDFGPDTLPHETGRDTLLSRVSFKKGCYLGQEVVARMESLGHPKQRLVGLRPRAGDGQPAAVSPFLADLAEIQTGCEVLSMVEQSAAAGQASPGPVVGAVTSAAMSPMLSGATVAIAMVKWAHAQNGRRVEVQVGGARVPAEVSESLVFWKR